jgi:hypothetical protein
MTDEENGEEEMSEILHDNESYTESEENSQKKKGN